MSCRGYDPKAVKLGKLIKIASASIHDKHQRGAFLRSFTKVAESELRSNSRKDSK
jgi:hypothetical protein